MTTKAQIIPRRNYFQASTGRTVSISGSVPWATTAEQEGWEVKEDGCFTVQWPDGSIGSPKPGGFASVKEAEEFLAKPQWAAFQGYRRFGD